MSVCSRSKKIAKDQKSDLSVKCPHCKRTFAKTESLGGHTSRAHPGKNKAYGTRIAIREQNAPLRALRNQVKEYIHKVCPKTKLHQYTQAFKNKIKEMILGKASEEEILKFINSKI